MKVVSTTADPVGYKPITLTLTFETPAEARALRALWGGSSKVSLENITDGAMYNKGVDGNVLNDVLGPIATALRNHLEQQGELL